MFRREPVITIADKQRPTKPKTLIEDVAVKTASEVYKADMDAISQAVILWVHLDYGERLDDFFYGSNLSTMVGLLPDEVFEKLGTIDLFWDRMESQIEIVKVDRVKSSIEVLDNKLIIRCFIVNDVGQHILIKEEVK